MKRIISLLVSLVSALSLVFSGEVRGLGLDSIPVTKDEIASHNLRMTTMLNGLAFGTGMDGSIVSAGYHRDVRKLPDVDTMKALIDDLVLSSVSDLMKDPMLDPTMPINVFGDAENAFISTFYTFVIDTPRNGDIGEYPLSFGLERRSDGKYYVPARILEGFSYSVYNKVFIPLPDVRWLRVDYWDENGARVDSPIDTRINPGADITVFDSGNEFDQDGITIPVSILSRTNYFRIEYCIVSGANSEIFDKFDKWGTKIVPNPVGLKLNGNYLSLINSEPGRGFMIQTSSDMISWTNFSTMACRLYIEVPARLNVGSGLSKSLFFRAVQTNSPRF